MHIALIQLYSSHPTADYDKVATWLREWGHTVWIATPNDEDGIDWHDGNAIVARQQITAETLADLSWPASMLARRSARFAHLLQARTILREAAPDVVQLNASGNFRFLPLGMPDDMHFVLDFRQVNEQHGRGLVGGLSSWYQNNMRGVFARWLYERSTFLHEAGARRVLGDSWSRWATVVPMGVDPLFLDAMRGSSNRPEKDVVRFVYIGRLDRIRGLELLLEAAKQLSATTGRFRLDFVGHDLTDGFYQDYAKDLGLEDVFNVRPPVAYERVPHILDAYDVALAYVPEYPADWQYHPTLKVLEYQAFGLPIIATDFEPNRDVVRQDVNGLLVSNTPAAFAAAMQRFVESPDFLRRCNDNAQAARQGLSWAEVAEMYLQNVYAPLMPGGKLTSVANTAVLGSGAAKSDLVGAGKE